MKAGDFVRVFRCAVGERSLGLKGRVREILHSEAAALVKIAGGDERIFRVEDLEILPKKSLDSQR